MNSLWSSVITSMLLSVLISLLNSEISGLSNLMRRNPFETLIVVFLILIVGLLLIVIKRITKSTDFNQETIA
ncbi:hypothetical protein D9754_10860 [Planomicrobium sp. Y74]|nr:hypothetical protein D9754_10860 [Planomicrobium sp. Y74]